MNVSLIYPRFNYPNAGGMYAPLGLVYLAAVAREYGHNVSIIDMTFQDKPYISEAALKHVDVVGISFSTPLASRAFEVLKYIKSVNYDIKCISGGPHPTIDPEECLKNGFDVVVIGEGEYTFADLLSKLEASRPISEVEGIAYLENGNIVITNPRPLIEDLDKLPFPARDLIDWETYLKHDTGISVITSRGCPYQCVFCKPMQEKLFWKKVRRRTPANVLHEIERILHDIQGHQYVFGLIDDTFTFSKTYIKSFCSEIERRGLKIRWWCQSRVDALDEEILNVMKKSGCVGLSFGVESGSQKVLDFLKKGIKVKDIIRTFDLCHKVDIFTHAYIIIGSPIETKKDLNETVKLLKRIKPGSLQISRLTPMRGSALYDIAKEQGLITINCPDEWDYCSNTYPLSLKNLSSADLDYYTWIMQNVVKNKSLIALFQKYMARSILYWLELWWSYSISFALDSAGVKNLIRGWSNPEKWGTWTDGDTASVVLTPAYRPKYDFELLIKGQAFLAYNHPSQEIDVFVNGHHVASLKYDLKSNSGVRVVKIPKNLVAAENNHLLIGLNLKNPKSPAELGVSDDRRRLGLGLVSLELKTANWL